MNKRNYLLKEKDNAELRIAWKEVKHYQKANNQKAVAKTLKNIIAINPNSIYPYNTLGATYRKLYKKTRDNTYLKRAIIVYEKVLRIRKNPVSLVGLAAVYCDLSNVSTAEAYCNEMIKYFGKDSYVINVMSRIASLNNEPELALQLYTQAQEFKNYEKIGLEMTESGLVLEGLNKLVLLSKAENDEQKKQNTNKPNIINQKSNTPIKKSIDEELYLESDYWEQEHCEEEYHDEELDDLIKELNSDENYNYYHGDDDWADISDEDDYFK
ncbi:hypothetical protein SYNTR_1189 [Candidatus Syntrophocurvum alkaliphilum]|uniref:Uncharacterized protein n=1 Tax=Candidatus Syntrophocurvum alkaliphilum TaxID=2293317 RepID=A0A6I6DFS0_9FIRM|nr:hypothetical protein [Candidatus Syntrophocurvum alkaliphilum]QGT99782.1 hypothetical protein SYNTR_1189 [Candidatus Syntrophocurvum alkaliphilum]